MDRRACPGSNLGGPTRGAQQRTVCEARFLPGPIDACKFLGRAADWDGTDRRWNNNVVVPTLRKAFAAGLAGRGALPGICRGDEQVLSSGTSTPVADVSGGTPSCARAHLFCFGAAEESGNPFDDEPTEDSAGGCDVGASGNLGAALLVGLMLVATGRRRSGRVG